MDESGRGVDGGWKVIGQRPIAAHRWSGQGIKPVQGGGGGTRAGIGRTEDKSSAERGHLPTATYLATWPRQQQLAIGQKTTLVLPPCC